MQPYLTTLVNRLMRQRSGPVTDEKRSPDNGGLVDQTFRMLQKRTDTALTDQILVADMLNESGKSIQS
jgi:hypothetical protein